MNRAILAGVVCMSFLATGLACRAKASSDATDVPVTGTDQVVYCLVGESLEFTGNGSAPDLMTRGWLKVDYQIVSSKRLPDTSDDDFDYEWAPAAAGVYHIRIGDDLANGNQVTAGSVRVVVLDQAPVQIDKLPNSSIDDITIHVNGQPETDFICAHVQVAVDGQVVKDGTLPFQVDLPFGSLASGEHTVQTTAFDSSGDSVICTSEVVTVPDRILVTVPNQVTLLSWRDTTNLSVTLANGVKPQRVDYLCDGDVMGSSLVSPYGLKANLSLYPSGQHQIVARLVTAPGATFDSPPQTVALLNQPDDQRQAAAEQAAAKAQAKAEADAAAAKAKASADLQAARLAEIARYAYIVNSPDVEMHPKCVMHDDGSWEITGSIINVGDKTIPLVQLYVHETVFEIERKAPPDQQDQDTPIEGPNIDPLVFAYVLADTYRNLRPGDSRELQIELPDNTSPLNVPPGYDVPIGPGEVEAIGYVPP